MIKAIAALECSLCVFKNEHLLYIDIEDQDFKSILEESELVRISDIDFR